MKNLLTIASLFALSITTGFSQDAVGKAEKMLSDNLGSFKASEAVNSKTDSEGITSVTRKYTDGDKSLELMIGIPGSEEKREMLKGYVDDIIKMWGKVTKNSLAAKLQVVDEENKKGALFFNPDYGGSTMSGVYMFIDGYMIKSEIKNGKGLEESRELLRAMGISVPAGAPSSKRTLTEIDIKMMKMLTDKLGSFTARGEAISGMIADGSIKAMRSYTNGNKTTTLLITHLASEESLKKAKNGVKNLTESYNRYASEDSEKQVNVVDQENAIGVLFYDRRNKSGSVYFVIKNGYKLSFGIKNAGADDAQEIYDGLDFSVL